MEEVNCRPDFGKLVFYWLSCKYQYLNYLFSRVPYFSPVMWREFSLIATLEVHLSMSLQLITEGNGKLSFLYQLCDVHGQNDEGGFCGAGKGVREWFN